MKRSNRFGATALVVVAATGLLLSGCAGGDTATPETEGDQTLRLAMNAPPTNFSVGNWGGGDATLLLSIYDSLFLAQPDGEITPGIAESWEYSEDRMELTLNIREGMEFSDGDSVDADAVVASLNISREGPATSGNLGRVAEVTAADESTVVLTLTEPDAGLIGQLSGAPGVVGAPDVLTAESSKLSPVGSGPYVLDEDATTVGSKYVLTKNEDNWNADAYPYETVEISVIADPTAVQNALQAGQLDYGGLGTKEVVDQFDTAKFNSGNTASTAIGVLWFPTPESGVVPALADVRVRQAINMAFDRETIASSINPGTLTATNQLYDPSGEAYSADLESVYEFDVEGAKELLAEAGYPDGFDVTMPSTVVSTTFESVIGQSLADIGVRVTWETVPFQDFYAKVFGGSYGMFFMFNGFNLNDAVDTTNTLGGVFNPTGYFPDELRSLVDTANASTEEEQGAAYGAVNEWLVEDAWAAPLFNVNGFYVVSTSIDFTSPKVFGNNLLPFQLAAGN